MLCVGHAQRELRVAGCSGADVEEHCVRSDAPPTIEIAPGVHMPVLGLGAAHFRDATTTTVLQWLKQGGRAIDTSADYGDGLHAAELLTGKAIKQSGLARKDLFITSKIPQTLLGYNSTLAVAAGSLAALGVDYLDLLLIHWPGVVPSYNPGHTPPEDPTAARVATWRALEELHKQGKVRAIGVSNFMPRHLAELFALEDAIVPAVNQFEYHVGLHDQQLLATCAAHNITVTGYAPLGVGAVLHNPVVEKIAAAHSKTAAEVAIRWLVQRGATTIPGANTIQYMDEDLGVFSWALTEAEMQVLDQQTSPGRQYSDPHKIP